MNFKRFHESKNLFDKGNTTIYSAYIGNDARWITISDGSKSIKMPVDSNTQYTLSISEPNSVFRIYETSNSNPEPSAGGLLLSEIVRSTNTKQYTFTTASDTKFIVFQGGGSTVDSWFNSLMLNEGSTALPYEPYSSEVWHDTPHYIHNTSTDTLTTLPADIYANDNNATVGLKGNMSQGGTPSPSSVIIPQECGERTGNLLFQKLTGVTIASSGEIVSDVNYDTYIAEVSDGETYTVSNVTGTQVYGFFTTKPTFGTITYNSSRTIFSTPSQILTVPTGENIKYIGVRYNTGVSNAMFNTGETALPYEPYGVKIPILSNSITTNVYLGEVQSTRRIKKYEFTGQESWTKNDTSNPNNYLYYASRGSILQGSANEICVCNQLQYRYGAPINTMGINTKNEYNVFYINFGADVMNAQTSGNTVAGLKEYLAAQYAAGTPVCVWYVLATPQTAVVNEPLRKIDTYADEVSGISIPTIAGANTISVGTTLQPSEVSVTYHGWHSVQSVHERESGAWT